MDRQALARIHAAHPEWGATGDKWARGVARLIEEHGILDVLDYGAGKGALGRAVLSMRLGVLWSDHEPAYSDGSPSQADLVICTHVLEHVADVPGTAAELARLARKAVFVSIGCNEGRDWAPNRNVHPPEWWRESLSGHFRVRPVSRKAFQQGRIRRGWRERDYVTAICYPKGGAWPG